MYEPPGGPWEREQLGSFPNRAGRSGLIIGADDPIAQRSRRSGCRLHLTNGGERRTLGLIESRRFPDGESYVRFETPVDREHVVLVGAPGEMGI